MEQTVAVQSPPKAIRASLSREEAEKLDNQALLERYKETGDPDLKWMLVLRYTDLVRKVASQATGIYSSFAQLDDVINEGILTLLDAVDKYDPDKGIKFETYVTKRIRGMVIDLARRQDWTPRSVRRKAREIDQATWELYSALGRFPTDGEMAQRLGVAESKYQEDLVDISLCNVISLDALLETQAQYGSVAGLPSTEPTEQPDQVVQQQELQDVLAQGIRSLRENEQMVLSLYYQKDLNMKEIAEVMGVSEPRISQIHTKAIQNCGSTWSSTLKTVDPGVWEGAERACSKDFIT